mgnify:CR=1 FL=1
MVGLHNLTDLEDKDCNFLYEKYTKKVGLILSVHDSTEYGDKNKWYKVQLTEPKRGIDKGYVRGDSIIVKNI